MYEILSISPVLLALLIGLTIPILIIVKSVQSYQSVNQNPKIYLLKAIIALAVWGGMSLFFMFFLAGYVMGLAHTPAPGTTSDLSVVFIFWMLELVYGGVGWLLIQWMKHREEV